ncbi:MAG: hypothetical protein ABII27_02375 [bacterium]
MEKISRKIKIKLIMLVFSISIITVNLGWCQTVDLYIGGKGPVESAWRSFFLPGWGQLHNDCKVKGWAIMGLAAVGASSTYILYDKAERKYDKYEDRGIKDDSLYNDYKQLIDASKMVGILTGIIWAYSVGEAYLYARDNDISLSFDNDADSLILTLNKKF